MHKYSFLFVFLFSFSFSRAMEEENKDKNTKLWKKIGNIYNTTDTQHISLNGNYIMGLEKVLPLRKTGFQFAQRLIGQDYSTIITHFFNKNFIISLFEIDSQGNYILCSHKKKLFIITTNSNNLTKLKFPNSITSLAVDPSSEYFAVGQSDGKVSLRGFAKGKCNLDFPKLHTTPIQTLHCDHTSVVCCDALGKNYQWRNIWSNKRHFITFNTRLPAIGCKIGKKYIVFQHAGNLIEFPRISMINKETKIVKKHFGTLIDITKEDELLIEQELTNLFCVSPEGTILDRSILPENCSLISNKKSSQPIPFILKREIKGEENSISELFMPIFSRND